jgi:hypothetical protein
MSLITGIIPPQNFEVVRDRIGVILADELAHQYQLNGNNADLKAPVFVERFTPFGQDELSAVNVCLAKGLFTGQTQVQTDGNYTFNIDVYHKAKSQANPDKKGDSLAMFRLQKILGMIRVILENPQYKTLGFTPPSIMNRHVQSIEIADPFSKQHDAVSSVMGRLSYSVRVNETCDLLNPAMIGGYETKVKLYLTDEGYFYAGYTPIQNGKIFDDSFDNTFE